MAMHPRTKTFRDQSSIDLKALNNAQQAQFASMVAESGEKLWKQRQEAYVGRWKEALAFARPGERVLDIGCGWAIPDVLDLIVDGAKLDYFCVDIDPTFAASVQSALESKGIVGIRASASPNTSIPYPSNHCDFVFSSHCLEHSN